MKPSEPISQYVLSKQFRDGMAKVSAKSKPFGNSTPSRDVFLAVADAYGSASGEARRLK